MKTKKIKRKVTRKRTRISYHKQSKKRRQNNKKKNKTSRKRKIKNKGGEQSNNNTKNTTNTNNTTNTAKSLRDEKKQALYNTQKAKADYQNNKIRETKGKIKRKEASQKLKDVTQQQKEARKISKEMALEQAEVQKEKQKINKVSKQKELEKTMRKSLSNKRKIKKYIKKHIGDEQYKNKVHPLIGKFLIKSAAIRKKIKKAPFLERGKGIATVTGNYEKYANEKLFLVLFPEMGNLKKIFLKKTLKLLKTIYMGNTIEQVNEAVSTPKPGMYIFIVLKDDKKPVWVGNMMRESRDVSEVLTKKLMEESMSQKNLLVSQPMMMPQQQMMYPQQQMMMPQQSMMYPQQPTVASQEKALLDTGLQI